MLPPGMIFPCLIRLQLHLNVRRIEGTLQVLQTYAPLGYYSNSRKQTAYIGFRYIQRTRALSVSPALGL